MPFQSLKQTLEELPLRVEEVVRSNVAYYKLFTFNFIAKTTYGLLNVFVLSLFGLLVLFFLSLSLAFALGKWMGDNALGFLSIGIFYIFVAAIFYIFRKRWIEKPLLEKLSEIYFKDEEDEHEEE